MSISRQSLINIHLTLAAFFLPFALMFLVTGALYTISIKGSSTRVEKKIALTEPLTPNLKALVSFAKETLGKMDMAPPTGKPSMRETDNSFQFEWGGVSRDIVLKPSADPKEAILIINENSLHRRMVQLHKGKGNSFSKAITIAWAIGLFAIFASGLAMAAAAPKYRLIAIKSGIAGIVIFLAYLFFG